MPDKYFSISIACSVWGFSSCRIRISAVILTQSLCVSCPGPSDEQGHTCAHTGQFTVYLRESLLHTMCGEALFLQVGITKGISHPLFLKNCRRQWPDPLTHLGKSQPWYPTAPTSSTTCSSMSEGSDLPGLGNATDVFKSKIIAAAVLKGISMQCTER